MDFEFRQGRILRRVEVNEIYVNGINNAPCRTPMATLNEHPSNGDRDFSCGASTTGYKLVRQFLLPAETVRNIWLPPRLSAISCFLPRLLFAKMSSCRDRLRECVSYRDCPRDCASCQESRQEAESREQSREETIYHVQQSRQKAGDCDAKYDGQSRQEAKIGGLV